MSNLAPTTEVELCFSEPAARLTLQVLPGRLTDLVGLPIRRLLPRSQRRTVGPWCFLISCERHPARVPLLGGAPFGEVRVYKGRRMPAPPFVDRPVP